MMWANGIRESFSFGQIVIICLRVTFFFSFYYYLLQHCNYKTKGGKKKVDKQK